jgi:hypothetical protein
MSKLPWFKFYPQDWLSDSALNECSCLEKGLLIHLLCKMHQGNPVGTLTTKTGQNVSLNTIKNELKLHGNSFRFAIDSLAEKQLILATNEGVYYNPRMVKDSGISKARTESGKAGGNPVLLNQNHEYSQKSEIRSQKSEVRNQNTHTEITPKIEENVCVPFVPSPLGLEMRSYAEEQALSNSRIVNKPSFGWVAGYITIKCQEWATQSGSKEPIIAEAWRDTVDNGLSKNPAQPYPGWYKSVFEARFTELEQAKKDGKPTRPSFQPKEEPMRILPAHERQDRVILPGDRQEW